MPAPLQPPDTAHRLAALVQRHQALIALQRSAFTLRMHRALSWLQRAEAAGSDDDLAFICQWIAFNAAYAQDTGSTDSASERQTFRDFVGQVCRLDADKALATLVWQVFPGPIRVLLGNCRIPDDCIDSKRYPLFIARAVLKELIESLQSIQGVKPC